MYDDQINLPTYCGQLIVTKNTQFYFFRILQNSTFSLWNLYTFIMSYKVCVLYTKFIFQKYFGTLIVPRSLLIRREGKAGWSCYTNGVSRHSIRCVRENLNFSQALLIKNLQKESCGNAVVISPQGFVFISASNSILTLGIWILIQIRIWSVVSDSYRISNSRLGFRFFIWVQASNFISKFSLKLLASFASFYSNKNAEMKLWSLTRTGIQKTSFKFEF